MFRTSPEKQKIRLERSGFFSRRCNKVSRKKTFPVIRIIFIRVFLVRDFFRCAKLRLASSVVSAPCWKHFLLLGQSARLYLGTCVTLHVPTNGMAWIFSLTPMPRTGIQLMSAQLYFFGGPSFRMLYRLSYRGPVRNLHRYGNAGIWFLTRAKILVSPLSSFEIFSKLRTNI